MSNGYDIGELYGDEFDELLRSMQTHHDPKQLQEFATRIPELIYAVRRAREERDEKLEAARLLTQVAEQLKDERDIYQRMLDSEREESARLRVRLDDVMRAGDLAHNRNVALLERAERTEVDAVAFLATIHAAANAIGAQPIKTPFDDDMIRLLDYTVQARREAGAAILAELEAAHKLAEAVRRLPRLAGDDKLDAALAAYDEITKQRERGQQ
jgi:hypothetical protein